MHEISKMTLKEKAQLVGGATTFATSPIESINLPSYVMADGHNGVNIEQLFAQWLCDILSEDNVDLDKVWSVFGYLSDMGMAGIGSLLNQPIPPDDGKKELLMKLKAGITSRIPEEGLPSCFPSGVVMGASWDPDQTAVCAAAVGREAQAFGLSILLGPNINIQRDPLGGRNFESFSEDPLLNSKIAVAYIQGLQSTGVAACTKHFVANNQETLRKGINAVIDERTLREIYLPAFKTAVEAGSITFMTAYNSVNGELCAEAACLLKDILRDEWGFKGFVLSDWGAVEDRSGALAGGAALEMPGPLNPEQIVHAVETGKLSIDDLDARVGEILSVFSQLKKPDIAPAIDRKDSVKTALEMALAGSVMLKNCGALPLKAGSKVALLGENCDKPIASGGGSAGVETIYEVSLRQGLENRIGRENIDKEAAVAVVCAGVNSREGWDRPNLFLDAVDEDIILEAVSNYDSIVVVLNVPGPVDCSSWIDKVDAVLVTWYGGMEMGNAVARILLGESDPGGRLPHTWPVHYEDCPSAPTFPGENGVSRYGEEIFVGYRYFTTFGQSCAFAFGHGLSYGTYQYKHFTSSVSIWDLEKESSISFDAVVKNIGNSPGWTVPQVYLTDEVSTLKRPKLTLAAFTKLYLKEGEEQKIHFSVDKDALAVWDVKKGTFVIEPGYFTFSLGNSVEDLLIKLRVMAIGADPFPFGEDTAIKDIMEDEEAKKILFSHLNEDEARGSLKLEMDFSPFKPLGIIWEKSLSKLIPSSRREAVKHVLFKELNDIQRKKK